MPETNLAITTADAPTLLFYVPESDSPLTVEFVLRNQVDELVYEHTFQIDGATELVGVSLSTPEGAPALAMNENYQWYFSIVAPDRANDLSVDGWIRRVALSDWIEQQGLSSDFMSQLAAAPPIEQARLLYQEAHLWNDAAMILHQLSLEHPSALTIASEWTQLLQAEGLTPPQQRLGTDQSTTTQAGVLIWPGR
jgi:hypothetical protein